MYTKGDVSERTLMEALLGGTDGQNSIVTTEIGTGSSIFFTTKK